MKPVEIASPDEKIRSVLFLDKNGALHYEVFYGNKLIIEPSQLGVKTAKADFMNELKIIKVSSVKEISETYRTITEKRFENSYQANEKELFLADKEGNRLDIVFRVSNDGVAFRYYFPEIQQKDSIVVLAENTTFKIPDNSTAWMHPHANVKDGWCRTQPSYEENYHIDIPAGTPAPQIAGWSFPALFKTGDVWTLISESGLEPPYCGARLAQSAPEGGYSIAFPQPGECIDSTDLITPVGKTPFYSPWRVIIIGHLSVLVESNLITALAPPSRVKETAFIKPGISSWSWGVLKDESVNYETQKEFIDLASTMGWQYCLIDADWDRRIGYSKIMDLIRYAKGKNVAITLWYNSSGDWNTTVYSPKSVLVDSASRNAEFERISNMGVKGIKVDFWPGDGPSAVQYYYDLLSDAAKYGLMVNFHGTTVPRGWSRTFPNLASMEAVKGFEYTTFTQENNDLNPVHCTVLPFTRNAVGHMDYTPVCLGEIPGIKKQTSGAFELALSVIFQSGIQHIVETPESMKHQPDFVKEFLKGLPQYWDDIQFIDGFPGKYVVLARRYRDHWYFAGINAQSDAVRVNIDLSTFKPGNTIQIITDGDNNRSFIMNSQDTGSKNITIQIASNGGFVFKI